MERKVVYNRKEGQKQHTHKNNYTVCFPSGDNIQRQSSEFTTSLFVLYTDNQFSIFFIFSFISIGSFLET